MALEKACFEAATLIRDQAKTGKVSFEDLLNSLIMIAGLTRNVTYLVIALKSIMSRVKEGSDEAKTKIDLSQAFCFATISPSDLELVPPQDEVESLD